MRDGSFNLAIETSGRVGSVTLGKGDQLLESITLAQPGPAGERPDAGRATPRNAADLMPAIDHLCQRHRAVPHDLGEVYLSTGPGSFTGLRVGVATAKMLGRFLGARLVAVSTPAATAMNVIPGPDDPRHLAVCLNIKKRTAYSAIFRRAGQRWEMQGEPALRDVQELLTEAPKPLMLLGQTLQEQDVAGHEGVRLLPPAMAQAVSDAVWLIGREMAGQGLFTDPMTIQPVYARPPEAVELWNQRHGAEPSVHA